MRPGRSPAGRRLALERKWDLNVRHYGGRVKLVTLTPPGKDVLPWGEDGKVKALYRDAWNETAQARATRLFEAAMLHADRWVRRHGWVGQLPRQLGNVRAEQKRGVYHFHWLLPYESNVERVWSKTVERFLARAWRNDSAGWPDEGDRIALVWRECVGMGGTRGFYGFGFVNGGRPQGRSRTSAADYMARNAAGYMAANVAGPGRHYVSQRLTRETGVTMRVLRSCNWLYVRRRLIAEGELDRDDWLPAHWSDEWAALVLAVWELLERGRGP